MHLMSTEELLMIMDPIVILGIVVILLAPTVVSIVQQLVKGTSK